MEGNITILSLILEVEESTFWTSLINKAKVKSERVLVEKSHKV